MNFEILVEPWKFLNPEEKKGIWGWIQFAILYFLYRYYVFAEKGITIGWLIVVMIAISVFFSPYLLQLDSQLKESNSKRFIELTQTLLFFTFYGFLIYIILCRRIPELTTSSFKRVLTSFVILTILLCTWIFPSFIHLGNRSAELISPESESV